MGMSHIHYLPLAPSFFAILVGFFLLVLILRSVRYAYESIGVSSNTAIFLLFATLIGSFSISRSRSCRQNMPCPTITSISLACVMPCPALAMGKARWLRSMLVVQSFQR